jgi:alkaline phosphatase D
MIGFMDRDHSPVEVRGRLEIPRRSNVSRRNKYPHCLMLLILICGNLAIAGPSSAQFLSHGPVFGGVDAGNAKIFVRTDQSATVVVQFGTDPALATSASSAPVVTGSASDFTAIIRISQLTPETTYYVNVLVNGVPQLTSPFPSFATFPSVGAVRDFKFVYLTDFATESSQAPGSYPSFANAAAEHPTFVFIGGDFDHSNPVTLNSKRAMFKALYNPNSVGMSDFVNKILRAFPIAHQWDDHDSGIDNLDKTYSGWSLTYQAFHEYVPSYDTPAPPPGIWQKFSYAQADLFVLDNRSQRDNEYNVDGVDKSMLDGRHLGPAGELAWLESSLLSSQATWKFVLSSVVTNPSTRFEDGWAGYQTEWALLKTFLKRNNIKNVIILAGDLHFGGIDNGTQSGLPEMLVGNVNIDSGTNTCAAGLIGKWSEGTYYNSAGSCRQYGVITVATNPDQVLLQVKDENGNQRISYSLSAN